MSRRYRTCLYFLLVLSSSITTPLAAQTKIMCVGDSITWGTVANFQPSAGGYRMPLAAMMTDAGWSYDLVGSQQDGPGTGWDRDHEGYPGWTIEQIDGIITNRLTTYNPDVMLLLIGTNNRKEGVATSFPRMTTLLNTIFATSPNLQIYIATLTPRTDPTTDPAGPQYAIDFNAQLPAFVAAQVDLGRNVHLVDLFGALLDVDLHDGVHPTLSGYHRMAETWFEALDATMGDATGNKPPTVAVSSPANGSNLSAGTPLTIEATASDPDGSITRVDFLLDQAYLGSSSSGSGGVWSLTLNDPPVGTHQIRAVAVDNRGAAFATPATVSVTVAGTAPFSYGLVGHWPMISGHRYQIEDKSGFGQPLHRGEFCELIDGAATPSGNGGLAIKGGNAFARDADQYDLTEDFAFAGWVKWGGNDGLYQTIIEKGNNYKVGTYIVDPGDTSAEIYLRIRIGGVTSNVISGLSLSPDTWHFLAVSKDGNQVTFRIDGTTATKSAPTTMETNTDRLTIGSDMDFSFDEFRLYNRPLSTLEMDGLQNLFAGSSPPPSAPENPGATAVAYNEVSVSWTDTSNNETSFVIERSLTGGGSGFGIAGVAGANTTTFSDTNVLPETTYYYRVFASNITADSAPSSEVSATTPAEPAIPPEAPSGLAATVAAADQIDLTWTDNSIRETGYVIERSTVGGGSGFSEIHVTAADVTSYSDTGLAAGTTYFYRVKARNSYGDSAATAEASAQTWTASAFPILESFSTGYTAGSDLNGQNGWSGSNLIEVDATGLEHPGMAGETGNAIRGVTAFASAGQGIVSQGPVGTDDITDAGTRWFAGLISMTDNSGTDYNYFRFLFDGSGGGAVTVGLIDNQFAANGSTSGFSGTQYAAGTTALIVVRMTVSSTATGTDETFDFWFNPTDASSEATLTSTAQGTILNKPIAAISGDWGSVTYGTDMSGSNLNTWYQDEIRVAESLADLNLTGSGGGGAEAPAAPDGLSATAVSDSAIDLSWTDNSNDETGFKVQRSATTGGPWTDIATTAADATSYNDTGLTAGTAYFYQIIATNANGDSSASAEASATTMASYTEAESWRLLYFGSSANSGDGENFNDFEDDGLVNIVERAIGHDPTVADSELIQGLGTGDINGNPLPEGSYWHFSYPRISGGSSSGTLYTADQIVYEVEWSEDLATWQPDDVVEISSSAPDANGIETTTVRLAQSVSSADKVFFRLRIAPVVPAAPENLASSSVSDNSVLLTWIDQADDETGYVLSISTDGVNFTDLPALPADSNSTSVTGLSPETQYSFRIRAIGAEGDSSSVAQVVTTTATPAVSGLLPFHIGNSLTQMREIPQQVSAFALADGYADHASIQSTISGHYLWEHWQGIDGSTAPDNSANGVYDTLILQGNSAEWAPGNIGNFRTNAQNFHNAGVANRDAQTWIYSYWQGSNEPRQWQHYVSEAFEGVRPQLTGGKWARIIPVGDAVEYFLQARDDGRITGIPREDFYSDTIHPTPTGGYFISLVHYAALYGVSPVGLPANNGVASVSASLATEMQTMIWEFLQSYPFAGVYPGMPAVAFDTDAYTGFAPLTVNFDATASHIPDGTESVSSVSWEILREGETTPSTHSGLTLAETFTNPGIYHVTAIATSSNGRVSPALTKAVRVSAAPSTPMIGVNFNADQGGSIAANEYAGIARQLNWNNYAGRTSGSIATLLDNAGNPSGSLTLSCPSGYKSQDTFAFPEPDFRLLHGFVRNDSSTALVIALTGLPAAFSDSGYQVIVYSNAFPNLSTYPDNRQILVDWGNNGTTDQTLTGLAQWAMSDYDEVRPDFDYSDASGAPQFYHLIDIPPGYTAFSLTIPASTRQFAISGIQVVAGP